MNAHPMSYDDGMRPAERSDERIFFTQDTRAALALSERKGVFEKGFLNSRVLFRSGAKRAAVSHSRPGDRVKGLTRKMWKKGGKKTPSSWSTDLSVWMVELQ